MSLSFIATGYEHVNKGGLQRLFGVGNSARYNHNGASARLLPNTWRGWKMCFTCTISH